MWCLNCFECFNFEAVDYSLFQVVQSQFYSSISSPVASSGYSARDTMLSSPTNEACGVCFCTATVGGKNSETYLACRHKCSGCELLQIYFKFRNKFFAL